MQALIFLSFVLSRLRFRGLWFCAKILGCLVFDLFRIRRRLILRNLEIAFPEWPNKQRVTVGRASVSHFIQTILELFTAPYLFPQAKYTIVGREHIEQALSLGHGMYGLCIHMSNWEFLCHASSKEYGQVHVVVKPIGRGVVADFIAQVRKKIGYTLVPRGAMGQAGRMILEILNRQEMVGCIVDQRRSRGKNLPFFGRLAPTNISLTKLYALHPAPILPVTLRREKPGVFVITYYPLLRLGDVPLPEPEEDALSLAISQKAEEMVRENPAEYFWMHNRWDLK